MSEPNAKVQAWQKLYLKSVGREHACRQYIDTLLAQRRVLRILVCLLSIALGVALAWAWTATR